MADTRVPPHSPEAEEAVLGALLLSRDALRTAREELVPEDFYRRGNGEVLAAAIDLDDRGEPVDAVTMMEEIKRRGTEREIGGLLRLQELIEYLPSTASVPHYARIVRHHAMLRRLISATATVQEIAYGNPVDPEKAMADAEEIMFGVTRTFRANGVLTAEDMVNETMLAVERANESRPKGVIPTGLLDLDRLLDGGLHPGNLIVLGARPSVGKSALATNIVARTLLERRPVLFTSLEMSAAEVGIRMAMDLSAADKHNIPAMVGAMDVMWHWPIRLLLAPTTVAAIRDQARREPPALVVVDYLHLLTGATQNDSRNREIGEYTRMLKILAMEMHVPVLALASLNRSSTKEDRPPRMEDLRDSGEIEAHADVIMLMHRAVEGAERENAMIILAKQRMGPTARIDLVYKPRLMRFQTHSFVPTPLVPTLPVQTTIEEEPDAPTP